MSLLKNKKINFFKYHLLSMILCGVVLLVGAVVWIFCGLNLSIDFTGGTVVNVKVGQTIQDKEVYNEYIGQIKDVMQDNNLTLAYNQLEGEGLESSILIRYQDINGKTVDEMTAVTTDFINDLRTTFGEDVTISQGDRITATASSALLVKALLAIFISSILIMIYVGIRFRGFNGACAIMAMILDVLLVFAFTIIFRIQIDSVYIAALITIIGYSINNNIVIFDRIRENHKNYPNESYKKVTNISINQSLTRTVIMTCTTLLTVIIVACVGLQGINSFIYPIIIGVTLGLVTALFVVSPLYAILSDRFTKNKKKIKNTDNLDVIVE